MEHLLLIILALAAVAAVGLLLRLSRYALPLLREVLRLTKNAPDAPEPKTVFGATSIFLPQIERDFPDFHNSDALAAVKTLVYEYLAIRYEGQTQFFKSIVSDALIATIDRTPGHSVKGEAVHKTAISDYVKTREYATITYQVSVGYLLDEKAVEERYAVEYTMRLRDEFGEKKALVCPQCGGAYASTSQKFCAYCGAGIVRDTIKSWRFTSISLS